MIDWTVSDSIATLSLSRPAARNAVSLEGWRALAIAMRAIAAAEPRACILRSGVPGIFSAGADLRELALLADDVLGRGVFRHAMEQAIEALAGLPMPTIAAIDGGCFGAAVALALACDIRIASEQAQFAVPPAKLGIGYPRGDVARLSALVGRGQAARLLFTGEPIQAHEAERIGLVEFRTADANAAADLLARTIAANDREALATLKRVLADPADPAHDADFEDSFGSAAFQRGTERFRT